ERKKGKEGEKEREGEGRRRRGGERKGRREEKGEGARVLKLMDYWEKFSFEVAWHLCVPI
ncbi:MAG: hypothetical protein ACKO0Y_08155, partial [Bacteroidota bacterium]